MRKIGAILLVLLMLATVGCGDGGNNEGTETRENGGPATETAEPKSESQTETDAESQTETKNESETESPVGSETASGNVRVILLDNDKDGVNDFKIVVDRDAALSTEKVPFRIADIDDPSEDSFRTVSLYDLKDGTPKLVWYTNLCMGSAPRGGVALKNGGVFCWYYDLYETDGGKRISISCYEYGGGNIYGEISYVPRLKTGSFVSNDIAADRFEDFGERNAFSLLNAVNVLDEMLYDAEILLDVTGTAPLFSTEEDRFTKSYAGRFDYRNLEASLDEENQGQYIVPIK